MNHPLSWNRTPLFVGSITTDSGLKRLTKPSPASDLIEIRVDALLAAGVNPEKILHALQKRQNPVLLTLRLPEEGGHYPWASGERAALFTALLPDVEAIDVELASQKELAPVLNLARKHRISTILSAHSLQEPVSLKTLQRWIQQFLLAKPTVAKIAVQLQTRQNLQSLVALLLAGHRQRWAVMGLGPTGELSRLILGTLGSALVYGYLDQPAAPGQPSIQSVRKLLLDSEQFKVP